ncbi:hypothetical protein Q4599_04395 [Cellulophaga lytica]|uniref:hypothetical protein n=1 Tax=Cellulophaga lytica TaxID=979 RepID=UPI0026E24F1B|nr:hypothetical protein [Cellulophaga lytica]MDO6852806.1 hypothetical protein [Cellulophaga lytica]
MFNGTSKMLALAGGKNGRAIVDKISGEEVIPAGQDFIINEAKKLTVDKSTLKMIFK